MLLIESAAEGVGFEPTIPGGIPVFKTGAIVHSAIPPQLLGTFMLHVGAPVCQCWRKSVDIKDGGKNL